MVTEDIIVSLRNVSKKYHSLEGETEAVKDLTLEVRRGEFITIVGPSGCGKTTLLSLISGLFMPSDGEILLTGDGEQHYRSCRLYASGGHLFKWRTILRMYC